LRLSGKVAKTSRSIKDELRKILDQKAALEKMIDELKNASGEKWIKIKHRVQKAQADFEASFKATMLEVI
jgi:hypothetical protein